MVVEQMNETPNLLIQLGEALGPLGSLVFLLLLCGGAVWVVMSVRFNRDDHHRFEAKVDNGFERLEAKVDTVRESVHAVRESVAGKVDKGRESVVGKIESLHNESREDSSETRELLRAINSRLDMIIDHMPPDRPTRT